MLENRVGTAPGQAVAVLRSTLWVRKSSYAYARIDNYVGDTLTRRIQYKDMQNVQGIWTARTLEMQDFTRNSRTVLKMESLDYNAPLRDDQFTLEALRRG